MDEWRPKPKKPVIIKKGDPSNIICSKCGYWNPRTWAYKIGSEWICHDCQEKK